MNAPKQITWLIAVLIAAVAVIEQYFYDFNLAQYTFYMMIASVLLLAIGSRVKGM